jgi:hypothetical protein
MVDDQLELGRLHDRQFRRSRPFENSAGITPGEAPSVRNAGSVTDQPSARNAFQGGLDGREAMPSSQGNQPVGTLEQEWIRADQKRPGAALDDRGEGSFEIAVARGWHHE